MHQLSLGQTQKHRNVLNQKSITKDQALNFLMQKHLQLTSNGDGDLMAFDKLSTTDKQSQQRITNHRSDLNQTSQSLYLFKNNHLRASSNLASKDQFLNPNLINNSNAIYKNKAANNGNGLALSAKTTARRRQTIFQDQMALQGLQNTLHPNTSQDKPVSQRDLSNFSNTNPLNAAKRIKSEFRYRNLSNQRMQTASARMIGQERKFANNISYSQIKSTRQSINKGVIGKNSGNQFKGDSVNIGKLGLSQLNLAQNRITKTLMQSLQLFFIKTSQKYKLSTQFKVMRKMKINKINNKLSIEQQIFLILQNLVPTAFKVNKHTEPQVQSLTEKQILKLFHAKLQDNNLPFQEQAFMHFHKHLTEYCINGKVILLNQYLGANCSMNFAKYMLKNQHVSTYDLSRNKLGDEGVVNLSNSLPYQSHIIKLNLSNNALSHKGTDYLFAQLIANNSIIDLNLDSNEGPSKNLIGPKGSQMIKTYFIETQNTCVLNHLSLKSCSLGNRGAKVIAQGLIHNKSLIELNLRGNLFTNQGLKYLVKSLPLSLLQLDISENDLKDNGAQTIVDYLFSSNNLRNFESSDEESESKSVKKVQKKQTLTILDEDFDPENSPRLQKLNLSKCNISIIGLETLLTVLMNEGTLKHLLLDQNILDIKTSSTTFIEKFFVYNNSLEIISLNECKIDDRIAGAIGRGLHKNTKLKQLYLSHNSIDNDGTIEIARALRFNVQIQLQALDLSFNNLKDLGAKELSQSMKLNQSLEDLNIKQNSIYIEGGSYLAHSMMENKKIKSIKADNNTFHIRYVEKMKEFSKRNLLNFQENQYPNDLKEHERLRLIKAQQGIFNKLKVEVEKEDTSMHYKLRKTEQEFQEFKEYEDTRYQYLVQKVQDIKDQVKQKDKEFMDAKERELYLEIHGDKQIRELIHFSQNFEKDKAYIIDDIQYNRQKLVDKKQKYQQEHSELMKQMQGTQDKMERAYMNYRAIENELKSYMQRNNIKNLKINNSKDDNIFSMQQDFLKMLLGSQDSKDELIGKSGEIFDDYNFKRGDSQRSQSIKKTTRFQINSRRGSLELNKTAQNNEADKEPSNKIKKKKSQTKSRNSTKKRKKSIVLTSNDTFKTDLFISPISSNKNSNTQDIVKSPISTANKQVLLLSSQQKKQI
eukprot:403336765